MTNAPTAADEPEWSEDYRAGWALFCEAVDAPGRHSSPYFARGFYDALATRQRTMRFVDFGLGLEWHEVDNETLAGMVDASIRANTEVMRMLCRDCRKTFDGTRGRFLCDDCENAGNLPALIA